MIETRVGNALDVTTGIIVHGCNCQGVMGGGIALEVRNRFPSAYNVYKAQHEAAGLMLGEITIAEVAPLKIIINACTQNLYGRGPRQVNYEAVAVCFERVASFAQELKKGGHDLEIVFPLIGAGLGGGNWRIIETIIDETVPDSFKKVLFLLFK